jgi:lipopolysaccharide biosynthesis regulator YciM
MEEGDLAGARKQLKRALSAAPDTVHALHVLARYQHRRGNFSAAAKIWEKCLGLVPGLAAFFVPRLEMVLFELGKLDRLDRLFQDLLDRNPGHLHLRLSYARFDARRNPERALNELDALLDEAPTLLSARREAARLVLKSGDPERIRRALKDHVALLARVDRGYRCESCGHTEEELFWRCPDCGRWDSVGVAWGRRKGEHPGSSASPTDRGVRP